MTEDKLISLAELEQNIENALNEAFYQWLEEILAEDTDDHEN